MKKLIIFLVGIALVNIMLIGVYSNQVEADEGNTKNVDVAIVLDNSGSMDQYGKWDNATVAAKEFISKLKKGDRCSIFCFNDLYSGHDEPMMLMGFTSINDAGIQSLNDAIDGLYPEYYTPLFDTIGTAMDYVVDNKRADSVGAIVALTDGMDNVCYEFYPSHDYREEKIVDEPYGYSDWGSSETRIGLLNCSQATFIIGLDIESASSTFKDQLREIAESSSGAYYTATEGTDLSSIYNQIAEKIDAKRDEGEEGGLPWLWILIIVIVVAVVAIVAAYLLKRKKSLKGYASTPGSQQYQQNSQQNQYQQPQQQQQLQQQPQQQTQNQQANQGGQQQTPPPPIIPVCLTCGGQMRLIPQYNRYWCDGCQQYK